MAAESNARYAAVARALREEIVGGMHAVGALLPTEEVLSARFSVSRHTVRAALRVLREERLIQSRQGAGSTVARQIGSEAFLLEAQSINDLIAYAADMFTEVRSTGLELVEGRTATRLGVAPGDHWFVIRGLARHRKRRAPICWSEYYVHRDFAGIGKMLPRNTGPIFLLIEEMFGVSVDTMNQVITTATMPRVVAEELGARTGEIAIEVRRTFRTVSGKLAQVTLHTHPAQRFQQTITMRRLRS